MWQDRTSGCTMNQEVAGLIVEKLNGVPSPLCSPTEGSDRGCGGLV